jgi:MoxR-like ATPase
MSFDSFVGRGERKLADENGYWPGRGKTGQDIDPASYVADDALVDAVNVALLLQQPLLLTGEPGTGKTQLASRIAWELRLEPLLKFETKSTSQSRDLFYMYDALARFQAGTTAGATDALPYIRFGPLGRAALLASENPEDRCLLDEDPGQPRRSVVLIDEIDKAPRDFPNDILNEIEHFYFRIPELGNREVRAPEMRRPVVIVTSNSEKDLPDAFLRRCVFHHIAFPAPERLRQIAEARLGPDEALRDALDLFYELRKAQLRKPPATAELLGWLIALRRSAGPASPFSDRAHVDRTIAALLKTVEDREEAQRVIDAWFRPRK